MLRGNKPEVETRFELLTIGLALITGVLCWVVYRESLPSLIIFVPGLILFGAALFQDLQPDWEAGWLSYTIAILLVAFGLAGIINTLLGEIVPVPWLIVALVLFGIVFVVKALYDPRLS